MAAHLMDSLAQLQNLIKRDAEAYYDEFQLQHRNFEAELAIFRLRPRSSGGAQSHFVRLAGFLANVAACYPADLAAFPAQIMALLGENYAVLQPDVRRALVKTLIVMRNRDLIEPTPLLKLFFELLRAQDKVLREMIVTQIVSDIRNINREHKNNKVNRAIQNFMYGMLQDENAIAAKKSLEVMITLFRKRVWADARTANVIATATLSKVTKLVVVSIRFFLNVEEVEPDSDSDDDGPAPGKVKERLSKKPMHAFSHKTRKRQRQEDRRQKKLHKARRGNKDVQVVFPAIQLLNDPQGLADKLFGRLKTSTDRFEVRLMQLNFLSRLIGQHKLVVVNFYSFVQRYLQAHQANVTQILAYLVQGCHDVVPPEELQPVLLTIANNFVSDRSRVEAIQVGLNAMREVIVRTPLVLEEEGMHDLVGDLIQYRKFRDKGVVTAARSLLNVIRETHPALLKRKERGRDAADAVTRPDEYGVLNGARGVDGVELLEEYEAQHGRVEGDEAWATNDGSDSDDDSDDSDGDGAGAGADGGSDSDDDGAAGIWPLPALGDGDADSSDDDDEEEEDEEDSGARPRAAKRARAASAASKGDGDAGDDDDDAGDDDDDAGDDGDAAEGAAAARGGAGGPAAARILTPRDFELIAKLRAQKAAEAAAARRGGRRRAVEMVEVGSDGEAEDDGAPTDAAVVAFDPNVLESAAVKKRRAAEARVEQARAEMAEKKKTQRAGGSTNAEKRRKKNFMMVRKSTAVQDKLRRSTGAQHRAVRKHLDTLRRAGKHVKKRR